MSVLVGNEFGVLARVAGMFSVRGFNIESLTVAETMDPTMSRITLVTRGDDRVLEQITKQLNKLIFVIKVTDFHEVSHVERELALIKVKANEKSRSDIMHIVDIFRANVIDVSPGSFIVEMTGDGDKSGATLGRLRPYGVQEIARTGKVAMHRGVQLLRNRKGKAA